jgi:hypothetical protein
MALRRTMGDRARRPGMGAAWGQGLTLVYTADGRLRPRERQDDPEREEVAAARLTAADPSPNFDAALVALNRARVEELRRRHYSDDMPYLSDIVRSPGGWRMWCFLALVLAAIVLRTLARAHVIPSEAFVISFGIGIAALVAAVVSLLWMRARR